jgi:serine/threonine protein kinase
MISIILAGENRFASISLLKGICLKEAIGTLGTIPFLKAFCKRMTIDNVKVLLLKKLWMVDFESLIFHVTHPVHLAVEVGTDGYMAPEIKNERKASKPSEIYSLYNVIMKVSGL